jgi:phosphatidylserine decarboxylase
MAVTRLPHQEDLDGPAVCVTIFLSLLDVHINRAPMSGEVFCRRYRPGKYLPAFKSHASVLNERNTVGIAQGPRKVLVHQITGFLARRIICDVQPGSQLTQRQRLGYDPFRILHGTGLPAGGDRAGQTRRQRARRPDRPGPLPKTRHVRLR